MMTYKNIRISEGAHTKLAQNCEFGQTLSEVLDRLLGITTDSTKKGVKK